MPSLLRRLERSAGRDTGITFVVGGGEDIVGWGDLHEQAKAHAAALQARGVRPGDHVALLSPTTRPLVTAIQGTWLAGATIVVLPLPMRLSSIDEFVGQTRQRIRNADAALVVVDSELAALVAPEPGDPPMVGFADLAGDPAAWVRPPDDPHRLAILQFTSGSTSDPKGVMLPDGVLCANLDAVATAAELDPDDDVLVSWLPLYHDMGLVGLLTLPMATGTPLVLGAPQDFTARPARWMEWVSAYGGTATAGPNFSYVLASRALHRSDELDLSRLRVALNGAEPIDPDQVESFVEAGPRHGRRAARPRGRRARDRRHVGHDRVLPAARRQRRAVPRGLAAHRRPRLPARRRAGDVRPDQGRDHRWRPQRVPRGRRAVGRRAGGCPIRQRDRLRRRRGAGPRDAGRGGRDQVRRPHVRAQARPRPRSRRRRGPAQGHRARGSGHPAEDELRQAPAVALQAALPRRPARARQRLGLGVPALEIGEIRRLRTLVRVTPA